MGMFLRRGKVREVGVQSFHSLGELGVETELVLEGSIEALAQTHFVCISQTGGLLADAVVSADVVSNSECVFELPEEEGPLRCSVVHSLN